MGINIWGNLYRITYECFKKLIVREGTCNKFILSSFDHYQIDTNCSPFVKVLETKLNIHGGARFGKIKSTSQKKCRQWTFSWISLAFWTNISSKEKWKRLLTYAYSIGKPNSWQTDNQGDRKWWRKKKNIPRPINFDKYRKNSAINGVFTNSRSNICQKISLKFLILRCEWKLILIMFHSCLSLQIRTWKNIEIKKNRSCFDVSRWRLGSLHHEMKIYMN